MNDVTSAQRDVSILGKMVIFHLIVAKNVSFWTTCTHGSQCDSSNVSKNFGEFVANHQLVDCVITNVSVRALINIGSMKFFLNVDMQRTVVFNEKTFRRSYAQPCVYQFVLYNNW